MIENNDLIEVKEELLESESQLQEVISDKEFPEKLETKGLKLKKSTKDKLNLLQGKFSDAETMISTLISQHEAFNIQENSKYSDRKAEIDKFNYFLDSIRNGFLNSLEMSTYLEEKYNEKLAKEMKKNEKVIISLQEDSLKLKEAVELNIKEKLEKEAKLEEVKESFSRVNLAMTAIEKELADKANIIDSLKLHIQSLTAIVNEHKEYKKNNEKLNLELISVKDSIKNYELINQENKNVNENNIQLSKELVILKKIIEDERELNLELNKKIQDILVSKNDDLNIAREKYENDIRKLEVEKRNDYDNYKDINFELKEKIYKLENELQNIKVNQ